jgi:methyl-accepting chemotaxis protein
MNWFRALGFTAKLTILALPALIGLIGLVSWIAYVNAANSEMDRQTKLLVELRGDIMTVAVVGTQYAHAVENRISDTRQAKGALLADLVTNIDAATQRGEADFPETVADAEEVLKQVRILQRIQNGGQDAVDEAGLLADLAQEAYKRALVQTAVLEREKADLARLASPSTMISLVIVVIGLVAALIVVIAHQISRPLIFAAEAMNDIARGNGDLTRRLGIDGEDEVGRMALGFNRFTETIERLVLRVKESTQTVGRTSVEIAKSSAELSERTSEAAAAVEETVSSLHEMASTVNQTADNARRANALADTARERARNGGDVVAKATVAMDEINASSRQIEEIVGVIDAIAFQTNILALNAAVEAARAGAQGRGFSVVAGEVRTLAQRSSAAAQEIRHIIADSVKKVGAGSLLVNESGQALGEIVGGIQQVSELVSEIAAATGEHATGIEQISKAVTQMDHMTQQNAALVEELAAATESLSEETGSLQSLLGGFRVTESASRAHKLVPATPQLRVYTNKLA